MIATRLGEDRLAIRPRVSELAELGEIERTDMTRRNASGRAARVWRINTKG
jgi:predicted ArsR family transcriptional regulator